MTAAASTLRCDGCGRKFGTRGALRKHTCVPPTGPRIPANELECPKGCGRVFRSPNGARVHAVQCKGLPPKPKRVAGVAELVCADCAFRVPAGDVGATHTMELHCVMKHRRHASPKERTPVVKEK